MKAQRYLEYVFEDNQTFIHTFDEAPLWSASFGLLLLKHIKLKRNTIVVDVGSGAGFPLLELAGRLGNTCKIYGVDPWLNATTRAKEKISNYAYSNVELIESTAEKLPFQENTIDQMVSNLGIHNFNNPATVFQECYRVLRPKGTLSLTTNLTGHWREFYSIFYETLEQIGKREWIPAVKADEEHRGTVESISRLYSANGFKVTQTVEEVLEMNFTDGSAFLNHHFVKVGWLTTWMSLFPKDALPAIFSTLEYNLNTYAEKNDGLRLSVPMLFMEGEKA